MDSKQIQRAFPHQFRSNHRSEANARPAPIPMKCSAPSENVDASFLLPSACAGEVEEALGSFVPVGVEVVEVSAANASRAVLQTSAWARPSEGQNSSEEWSQ